VIELLERLEPVLGHPVQLETLKHKAGRRTTYRARGARRNAIVKVYASGRAPTVAARIAALAHGPDEVEVPTVILCSPELHLLVLSEVPGVPLREALLAGEADACARAGFALGAWHRTFQGLQPGPLAVHTLERELEILRDRIKIAPPEVAKPVRTALRSVVDRAWPSRGAVHRDLYEEQIMVGERIGLIDLDDAALGPPELDIGNVLGHLDLLELRSERRLGAVIDALLHAYRESGPELDPALLSRCRSLTLLRLVCIHEEPRLLECLPDAGNVPAPSAEDPGDTLADSVRGLERRPDWLVSLADDTSVASALVRTVPEFAAGELELRACTLVRIRIGETSQRTLHRITVAGAAGERELQLHGELVAGGAAGPATAHGTFGTDDWRCNLPELHLNVRAEPPRDALSTLIPLTDPDAARAFLETAIRSGSPAYADVRITACVPQVLRGKAARATVVYDLEFPDTDKDGPWPTPVFVKTYRRDESRKVYEAMTELWSKLGGNEIVAVAEPLALLPELAAFVQGPVLSECRLDELVLTKLDAGTPEAIAELSDRIARTAVGLAELHGCGASADDVLTWTDELAEIRGLLAALAALAPEASRTAVPLLARLEALERKHSPDPTVPTHGSFRSNQVLVGRERVGFIDFDRFCHAEPARDLALFRAALRELGLRPLLKLPNGDGERARANRLAVLDELCETFIARYETVAPVSRVRVALWEALDLFTLVLYCWTKLDPGLEHRLELLRRHLHTLEP
jgi:Ser/Thr protein kinase RdoA (MazF antagonist)